MRLGELMPYKDPAKAYWKRREWVKKNRAVVRASQLKHYHEKKKHSVSHRPAKAIYDLHYTYGISIDEARKLHARRQGGCEICGNATLKRVVDHDHTTGKIRGILCINCNSSIGLAGDSAHRLRQLANYLEAHELQNFI